MQPIGSTSRTGEPHRKARATVPASINIAPSRPGGGSATTERAKVERTTPVSKQSKRLQAVGRPRSGPSARGGAARQSLSVIADPGLAHVLRRATATSGRPQVNVVSSLHVKDRITNSVAPALRGGQSVDVGNGSPMTSHASTSLPIARAELRSTVLPSAQYRSWDGEGGGFNAADSERMYPRLSLKSPRTQSESGSAPLRRRVKRARAGRTPRRLAGLEGGTQGTSPCGVRVQFENHMDDSGKVFDEATTVDGCMIATERNVSDQGMKTGSAAPLLAERAASGRREYESRESNRPGNSFMDDRRESRGVQREPTSSRDETRSCSGFDDIGSDRHQIDEAHAGHVSRENRRVESMKRLRDYDTSQVNSPTDDSIAVDLDGTDPAAADGIRGAIGSRTPPVSESARAGPGLPQSLDVPDSAGEAEGVLPHLLDGAVGSSPSRHQTAVKRPTPVRASTRLSSYRAIDEDASAAPRAECRATESGEPAADSTSISDLDMALHPVREWLHSAVLKDGHDVEIRPTDVSKLTEATMCRPEQIE